MARTLEDESTAMLDAGSTAPSKQAKTTRSLRETNSMAALSGLVKLQLDQKVQGHAALLETRGSQAPLPRIVRNHGLLLAAQALWAHSARQMKGLEGSQEEGKVGVWKDMQRRVDFTRVSTLGLQLAEVMPALSHDHHAPDNAWVMLAINSSLVACLSAAYNFWASMNLNLQAPLWGDTVSTDTALITSVSDCITQAMGLVRDVRGGTHPHSSLVDSLVSETISLADIFMRMTSPLPDEQRWDLQFQVITQLVMAGQREEAETLTKAYKVYRAMREFYWYDYVNDSQTFGQEHADERARMKLQEYAAIMGALPEGICDYFLTRAAAETDGSMAGFYYRAILVHLASYPDVPQWISQWCERNNASKSLVLDLQWLYYEQQQQHREAAGCVLQLAEAETKSVQKKKVQLCTAKALFAADGRADEATTQHLSSIVRQLAEASLQERMNQTTEVYIPNTLLEHYLHHLQEEGQSHILSAEGDMDWSGAACRDYVLGVIAGLEYVANHMQGSDRQRWLEEFWRLVLELDDNPSGELASTSGLWPRIIETFDGRGVGGTGTGLVWGDQLLAATLASTLLAVLTANTSQTHMANMVPNIEAQEWVPSHLLQPVAALWAQYGVGA
eukprot:comp22381_c3_seq1/m.33371 comp22381_c3_seq1/g.33371  ORF comp22381_c3_seq1/g.33371 comp22381_c3_seq1/m.33371 type:complete len:617 (-) comp22381_c3_seq1:250-2100(-)